MLHTKNLHSYYKSEVLSFASVIKSLKYLVLSFMIFERLFFVACRLFINFCSFFLSSYDGAG